jgi:hypothetical protein
MPTSIRKMLPCRLGLLSKSSHHFPDIAKRNDTGDSSLSRFDDFLLSRREERVLSWKGHRRSYCLLLLLRHLSLFVYCYLIYTTYLRLHHILTLTPYFKYSLKPTPETFLTSFSSFIKDLLYQQPVARPKVRSLGQCHQYVFRFIQHHLHSYFFRIPQDSVHVQGS